MSKAEPWVWGLSRYVLILITCASTIPGATQADASKGATGDYKRSVQRESARTDSGSSRRRSAQAAPRTPESAPASTESSRPPSVSYYRRGPNTSVMLPSLLMTFGGLLMIAGSVPYATGRGQTCEVVRGIKECEKYHPAAEPVGKGFMIGGAAVMAIGLIVLPIRLVARNRLALRAGTPWAAQHAVEPWVDLRGRHGSSVGLVQCWRF